MPTLVERLRSRLYEESLGACAEAADEIERLTGDLTEARTFAEKTARQYNELLANERILRCAFCDTEYPPGTPSTQAVALTEHVKVCQKHPMRYTEQERDALRELVKARPVYDGVTMRFFRRFEDWDEAAAELVVE